MVETNQFGLRGHLGKGKIEPTGMLPQEVNEPALHNLPRLRLWFDGETSAGCGKWWT